jgi:outer membrane protein TolC
MVGEPQAVTKQTVAHQCQVAVARLLICSFAFSCGCVVHVAMGIDEDEPSGSTAGLRGHRLKLIVDRSRRASAVAANEAESESNPETRSAKRVAMEATFELPKLSGSSSGSSSAELEGDQIRPVSEWRAGGQRVSDVETTPSVLDEARFAIDLTTALRLAGARNWNTELAAERVLEARAAVDAAEAMWMPSLIGGLGFTHHSGQLQAISGEIQDVRRSSLFVGGGARTGKSSLAGGGGGPMRLSVDLSVADAIFLPLVARQQLGVEQARESVTFNDTLRNAALAYLDLVEAQGQLANLKADLSDSEALLRQTRAFVIAGKGSNADTTRIAADVERRRQRLVSAEGAVAVASASLARQLRMNPATTLFALEEQAVPVELLDESETLTELIATAMSSRPELEAGRASLDATASASQAEDWRPWLPHLSLGVSAGGFGGGAGGGIGSMDGRSDFDLLAVWELENLGLGTQASRDAASSRERQARLRLSKARDDVATEVTAAWHRLSAGRRRLEISRERLKQAGESLRLHRLRIRSLVGLPLEAQQAVSAISQARQDRLEAIVDFNRQQVGLLRAIGRPAGSNDE